MFRSLLVFSCFLLFASCGKHESIRLPGVEQNAGGSFAKDTSQGGLLQSAIENGDLGQIKSLIAAGFPLESPLPSKRTALLEAIVWNRRAIVEFLVSRGANLAAKDSSGSTALDLAKGNINLEQALLPEVKAQIEEELFRAVLAKDAKAVKKSLETDFADPNARNADGETVFTLSIKLAANPLFRTLLQKRGSTYLELDLNLRNTAGESPLALARAQKLSAVISHLEKNGALE
jgi:ankyrin repeat protein